MSNQTIIDFLTDLVKDLEKEKNITEYFKGQLALAKNILKHLKA